MADPDRMLDDPGLSPLARSVLRSADGDGPDPAARRRIAAAIGIGVGGMGASAATAAATGLWWKLPLVVLGLVGAGTTAYVVTRPGAEPAAGSQQVVVNRVEPTGTKRPAAEAPAVTPDVKDSATVSPVAVAPPPTSTSTSTKAPAPRADRRHDASHERTKSPDVTVDAAPATDEAPTATTDIDDQAPPSSSTIGAAAQVDPRALAAEVEMLDRARAQLQHHDITGALATLALHARSFPGGALAAEAEMLRVEATLAAGDHDHAVELARTFLERFPDSPLAPRARAIVDGARRSP